MAPHFVVRANVPCGNQHDSRDLRIMGSGKSGHVPAHAVTNHEKVMGVDSKFLGIVQIEEIANFSIRVLGGTLERKVAFDSPRATVMHREHVPTVGSELLRDIEILLKTGESVQYDGGRMQVCASGKIEDA